MTFSPAERRRLIADRADRRASAALEDAYYASLPRPVIARCPVCGQPVRFAIDTEGLDGPWWDQSGRDLEPQACQHYHTTLGAVNLGHCDITHVAPQPANAVHLGPAAPFVVPALLGQPGMQAVLCILPVPAAGCTVYLISYFAAGMDEATPRPWPWPRSIGGRAADWDFDLEPHTRSKPTRLSLYDPDRDALRHDDAARAVLRAHQVPGPHAAQCIRGGQCLTTAGPTPVHELDPFD